MLRAVHLRYACLMLLPVAACECSVSLGGQATDQSPSLAPPEAPRPLDNAAGPAAPPPSAAEPEPTRAAGPVKLEGGPADVHGELPAKRVSDIIQRHQNELRFCYEQQANAPDPLALQAKIIIGPTGAVQTASVDIEGPQSGKISLCLGQAIRRWTFPAPKGGGIVVVTYPLQFRRE